MIELHRKWIEALRSGNYNQGTGEYCVKGEEGDRHCCLGVLAEVAGVPKRHDGHSYEWQCDDGTWTPHAPDTATCVSKMKLWSLLGSVKEEDWLKGTFNPETTGLRGLWILNDKECWTFEDIADYLEQHIEHYTVD